MEALGLLLGIALVMAGGLIGYGLVRIAEALDKDRPFKLPPMEVTHKYEKQEEK